MSTVRKIYPVLGMGCAACVARVESALRECEGVKEASVSLASSSARIDFDPGRTSPDLLRKSVVDAGYDLVVEEGEDIEDEVERLRQDEYRSLRRDARLSVVVAILVMVLSMGFRPFPGRGVLLAALSAVSVLWCGRRFIGTALSQARRFHF